MDWYWIVLIAVGGAAVIYVLLCSIIAKALLKSATTPKAHSLEQAREFQIKYENMNFDTYDRVWKKEKFEVEGIQGKIRGEIIFSDKESDPRKVAVICHGHTWNRINSVKYADIFYAMGYNIVIYDHAYFGESDGKSTTLGDGERYDLSSVLHLVREKFGKDAFVGLHGESLGAATVLLELGLRKDIDFVVADCAFSDTMTYYRQLSAKVTHLPSFPVVDMANLMSKRKNGYDFRNVSPIAAVKQSETPICFIHGKADKFILPEHSEKMYAVSNNSLSELHLFEDAGHARSHVTNKNEYWKVVTEFVEKVENTRLMQ
ncbi:MAG: alpha/beta hydrolase [Corallococcus sp.]|nr:alpha/beta hydrolase [Corallococcus sp.]MCM1359235.1 alpha/beta hydrolase [Corallococcus sp.]MCM1394626.1 alpha/beta hydrolase [Corallococcus sp.]